MFNLSDPADGDWFPTIMFDLSDLADGDWDYSNHSPGALSYGCNCPTRNKHCICYRNRTSGLILQDQNFHALQQATDLDVQALEKSIQNLEDSLSSLAEVTLQNRWGLDLLFLKRGGLYVALDEQCCFYVNRSGLIRQSLAKIRKRLTEREKDKLSHQNWYESLFSRSP